MRSFAFLLLVAICVAGLRLASEGIHHYADNWGRPRPRRRTGAFQRSLDLQAGVIQARNRRIVYPYSVVPGGVISADELREAAAHDASCG